MLIGMVQILLPFMIFPLFTVMSRIDPSYAGRRPPSAPGRCAASCGSISR